MIKFKKMINKNIKLLITIIISSLLGGYIISKILWNSINIPFSNPDHVVGKLTLVEQNPLTNSIRWMTFTVLPSIIFLTLTFLSKFKKSLINFFNNNPEDSGENSIKLHKFNFLTIVLIALIPIIQIFIFLQKDLTVEYFDVFHEGVELTPAFNYLQGKGIWSGTLFVRGAFQDLFTAIVGWKIFGVNSIGSYRIIINIANLLIPTGLSALLFAVWHSLENKHKGIIIIQSMLFFYLYSAKIQYFDRRDAPLLLGISVLIFALNSRNKVLLFIAGIFSAVCSFYSLDVGIYFTALSLFIPFLEILLSKRSKNKRMGGLVCLFIGFLAGWLLFYIGFKPYEFSAFWGNFIYILKYKDLLDGLVYPIPSLFNSFRYTFPLLIGAFNLIALLIAYLKYYSKGLNTKIGYVHFILTLMSLLHFRSALGRSDLMHIEYSSSFLFIVLGFNFALIIWYLNLKQKYLKLIFIILASLNIVALLYPAFRNLNLRNLFTVKERVNIFVNKSDYDFYNQDRLEGVKKLEEIFKDERCIFDLSSSALTPYMLKKPSCGYFYISYFASSDSLQKVLINDLRVNSPNYIIYETKMWTQNLDGITNIQRLPKVLQYVNSNYSHYEMVSDYWEVYKRNE